jgi:hypothetical protein
MSASGLTPYATLAEIELVFAAFENASLPRAEWTHRAHLTVAACYLSRHPLPQATPLIRDGIRRLNRAQGTVDDADHGYHETITLFYIGAIAHFLGGLGPSTSHLVATNRLLAERGHIGLPLEYYSSARLWSRESRARWVEPDLRPLEWVATP